MLPSHTPVASDHLLTRLSEPLGLRELAEAKAEKPTVAVRGCRTWRRGGGDCWSTGGCPPNPSRTRGQSHIWLRCFIWRGVPCLEAFFGSVGVVQPGHSEDRRVQVERTGVPNVEERGAQCPDSTHSPTCDCWSNRVVMGCLEDVHWIS